MKKLLTVCSVAALGFAAACNNSNAGGSKDAAAGDGGGVSGGGSDYYYEMTAKGGGRNFKMNMLTKLYCSSAGKVRMEMQVGVDTNGTAVKQDPTTVLIGDAANPTVTYELNSTNKTYTKNIVDTGAIGGADFKTTSSVEKLGDETIEGFHCVHARVISKKSMGNFYSDTDTTDLWASPDVPMQSDFQHWYNRYQKKNGGMFSADANEKLLQLGCKGLYVRMQMRGKESDMTMEFTKVERRDLAGSLFGIPAGYTEAKNGGQ